MHRTVHYVWLSVALTVTQYRGVLIMKISLNGKLRVTASRLWQFYSAITSTLYQPRTGEFVNSVTQIHGVLVYTPASQYCLVGCVLEAHTVILHFIKLS